MDEVTIARQNLINTICSKLLVIDRQMEYLNNCASPSIERSLLIIKKEELERQFTSLGNNGAINYHIKPK